MFYHDLPSKNWVSFFSSQSVTLIGGDNNPGKQPWTRLGLTFQLLGDDINCSYGHTYQ